ncbi:hypothetical protein PUNSTDRAFT_132447 [Punctularia strigosozonata HHB-11173 SS5]|uniref:uncharacterized protein n=1 Tax=Punctularia strigosozonata (strain HHB-11173) TaxID=741275 RepID=UPI0004416598|nr:uncharacterized protein PUNSTDRAFT_132447 [Punctularia strigosozonata HHB-11173 SS5]EIN10353.1 hypothetical protein PUNSTDRAFT_132447 [Punctularia strigosozonata HHB-11173 SS5]
MPPTTPSEQPPPVPANRARRVSAPVKTTTPAVLVKEQHRTLPKKPAVAGENANAHAPATLTKSPPALREKDQPAGAEQKKINRRGSKPIIHWFQRKLGGTRTRRASEASPNARPPIPNFEANGVKRTREKEPAKKNGQAQAPKRATMPPLTPAPESPDSDSPPRSNGDVEPRRQNAVSLNTDTDAASSRSSASATSLLPASSRSPSTLEADDDASLRPLPGSAPPSPSPSHAPSFVSGSASVSTSPSYRSDPRTFRSLAASTKPTTVLSVDLTTGGMAHIAQAPPTTPSPVTQYAQGQASGLPSSSPSHPRLQHVRTPTAGSITFSVPRPSSLRNVAALGLSDGSDEHQTAFAGGGQVQAPNHTVHHPRDNPRPSSPPPDDASVLTLASSAYAVPGARGGNPLAWAAASVSYHVGMDSRSQFGFDAGTGRSADGEHDHGEEEDGEEEGDGEERVNASVRALRPRRSWESEASRWSARVGMPGPGTASSVHGPATPSEFRTGLWGPGSVKTGGFGADGALDDEKEPKSAIEITNEGGEPTLATEDTGGDGAKTGLLTAPAVDADPEATPSMPPTALPSDADRRTPPPASQTDRSPSTPSGSVSKTSDYFATNHSTPTRTRHPSAASRASSGTEEARPGALHEHEEYETDFQSIAATDAQTDVWHSAPTTPAAWD